MPSTATLITRYIRKRIAEALLPACGYLITFMIRIQYPDATSHQLLAGVNAQYPYPFLESYHRFENALGHSAFFLADESSGLLMPVMTYRSRFLVSARILFHPLQHGQRVPETTEKYFLEKVVDYLRYETRVHRIIQPLPLFHFSTWPQGSLFCPAGLYEINLQQEESKLFGGFRESYRRQIRRGAAQGVEVRFGAHQLDPFHRILTHTMHREKTYLPPLRELQVLMNSLGEHHLLCGIAYAKDQPLSGILLPFSGYGADYLYGGTLNQQGFPGSHKLLFWEAMKQLRKQEIPKLVLGVARLGNTTGSRFENIQQFKEGFGPKVVPGCLWKQTLRKVPVGLFQTLLAGRNFMSGKKTNPDIIDSYRP